MGCPGELLSGLLGQVAEAFDGGYALPAGQPGREGFDQDTRSGGRVDACRRL